MSSSIRCFIKKVDEKNNMMMSLLQSISSKMNTGSTPISTPSFTQTYAGAAAAAAVPRNQGRQQYLNIQGGNYRDRSPSVKRTRDEVNQPSKRRNTEKHIVTGTRTMDKIRKMKSPPADIFVYGVPRDTTKADIVDDLAESDIQISPDDIQLMSKGNPAVVSYKISVKAQDLQKALDPTVWPLRVKVREFIYYKKRPEVRQTERQGERRQNVRQASATTTDIDITNIVTSDTARKPGVNMFNILNNDVPA